MVLVFRTHGLAAADVKALLDGVQLLMNGFTLSSPQALTLDKYANVRTLAMYTVHFSTVG
jgi:hypothetical protein